MSDQKPVQQSPLAQMEERTLELWDELNAFEESVRRRPEDKQYVFYDGPPFATGLPHYGHMLASTVKDSVPRFWTMRGYRVERKWGWDCHGLPIENIVEKQFGLNSRKDIEEYGIDKFNEACRSSIFKFDKEWGKFVRRIGRWVDFENSYKTMDNSYMESVWWAFSELNKKELVYEGRRVSLYCPRCATPLSNFEIAMDNSYQDVEDNSITVKFRVADEENTSFLAWTTTPWTLPGNVALVVDAEADYVRVQDNDEFYYCAQEAYERLFKDHDSAEIVATVSGSDLVGKEYEPLYTYMPTEGKKAYYVIAGDFVELSEGTGIVHTAAIFGEDDFRVAQEHDLPLVPTLDENGKFTADVTPWTGVFYKDAEEGIMQDLSERGLMFQQVKYNHSYPFCWRCDTPLYYFAGPAWFIDIQKIKPRMLEQNKQINWRPEHLKEGRFGKGLETAPDWNISRSRFWGTAIPVWNCDVEACEEQVVIGSVQELSDLSGKDLSELDLHRPYIDEITFPCPPESCDGTMKRIPDVFDCWVESGSMPFASRHYPFENQEQFEQNFPGEFISEYIAQTRGWFYTLHVLSTALFDAPSFVNSVTTGTIKAEDGSKMSKSKKNYPDPDVVFNQFSVDAVRFFLLSSPVMDGAKVNFSEKEVGEIYRKTLNTAWNVVKFYKMFADQYEGAIEDIAAQDVEHALDKWIFAKLEELRAEVTAAYEDYRIRRTAAPLQDFVQELSTWYVRRSRDRFKGVDEADKLMALRTLRTVLKEFAKIAAPPIPFMAEQIFQETRQESDEKSVHWCDWPESTNADASVLEQMQQVRDMIEQLLALRAEAKLKVRQPLASATVTGAELSEELQLIIREELNVKEVRFADAFAIDTELTEELQREGLLRELVRQTNALRKKAKLTIADRITVKIQSDSALVQAVLEHHSEDYTSSVLADSVELVADEQEHSKELNGEALSISIAVV